jgi:hypothetical protein
MTGPEPDVSREYLPGASGEGWTSLSPGSFADTLLVRVTPFRVGGASRYIALDPDAVAAAQANAAADDTGTGTGESTPALDAAPGATVVTAEDRVNLRDAPSTTGQIVRELERGTELVVTGEPTDADGYLWYPVDVVETGESGFVAGIFLQASPN